LAPAIVIVWPVSSSLPITKWMRLNWRVSQASAVSDFNDRRQRAEKSRRYVDELTTRYRLARAALGQLSFYYSLELRAGRDRF
jgi:hypothetical protein